MGFVFVVVFPCFVLNSHLFCVLCVFIVVVMVMVIMVTRITVFCKAFYFTIALVTT